MSRTYVVTGAGSGIGAATAELLRADGHRVIGVDLRGADVVADLAHPDGIEAMTIVVGEQLGGAALDGVITCAGLAAPTVATVAVNYFGSVNTLEALRPLQAGSASPRSAAVASFSVLWPHDATLLDLLLGGDVATALAVADEMVAEGRADLFYATSKLALARWIRRAGPGPDWAGAGIALNAVAPGIVATPMTEASLADERARRIVERATPMPLGGIAQPADVAHLLTWLTSAPNTRMCGQVVFIDGGAEAVVRGDSVV